MNEEQRELRFQAAQRFAREAAELGVRLFRNTRELRIVSKSVQNPVSNADKEIEALLHARITAEFPNDSFFGEEDGPASGANPDKGIWVVDPVDGTDNFIRGISGWTISIAFVIGRTIEVGVIYDPLADEMFAAQRGHGATLNGVPLAPGKATRFRDGLFGIGYSLRRPPRNTVEVFQKILDEQGMYQRLGSGALMIAYVAAGRYIGMFEAHINAWDCLAGVLLVRESGGWTNDFLAGEGLFKGNVLACAGPGMEEAVRRVTGL